MDITLFDDERRKAFLPLVYTRPVADIRIGILTMREKWRNATGIDVGVLPVSYLQEKFGGADNGDKTLLINARLFPEQFFIDRARNLAPGQVLSDGDTVLAFRPGPESTKILAQAADEGVSLLSLLNEVADVEVMTYGGEFRTLNALWDLFSENGAAFQADLQRLGPAPFRGTLGEGNLFFGDRLHLGTDVKMTGATINTNEGAVFIDDGAEIMEGANIRGPVYIGKHAVVKMGAKIYGPTTLGPWTKVGGEVNNVVFQGYANKAHDGFLGNSVIGQWCNLGADTNNSNLKNNYGRVRAWSYEQECAVDTGLSFCGLFMGDHAKCGINTMFNTGTTVGMSANIYGGGFPPKFLPSFYWGAKDEAQSFELEKAIEVAGRVMGRRDIPFTEADRRIFEAVFRETEGLRKKAIEAVAADSSA